MSPHCALSRPQPQITPCALWGCGAHVPLCSSARLRSHKTTAKMHCPGDSNFAVHASRETPSQSHSRLLSPVHLAAVTAAAIISFSGPALADIQTVAPGQAAQYAQPIPPQTVNKRTVWLLFGGGAAAIFGSALLLEKNQRFFPAIYKANETMRKAKEADQARALTEKAVLDLEQQDDMRLQRSVEAGLANAQARVLPEASPSNSQQQDTSQAAATHGSTSSSSSADPAASQSSADASGAQDVDQLQQQQSQNQSPYGKGSTLSDEEKQQAAVNSVK